MAKPLPDVSEFLSSPSFLERSCLVFPIVGWVIGNELVDRRIRRARAPIAKILESRPSGVSSNPYDSLRAEVLSVLRKCIRQLFDWPNDSFLETDRMSALLLGYDDLLVLEFEQCLVGSLGVKMSDSVSLETLYSQMTLGEVADLIIAARSRTLP
jgi:hypothetical protein